MADIVSLVRILVILLLIALTVILFTRWLAVPYTLGLVVVGLLIGFFVRNPGISLTPDLVLFVFLPALLFEGSWSISVRLLQENWVTIFLLAVPGVLLEVVLIAVPLYFLTILDWSGAFLLSAILSPTDPVAVLGLFRQLKVNAKLSTIIEGESLFNDGVAGALYQVFLAFVLVSAHSQPISGGQAWLNGIGAFLLNTGGGVLIGSVFGFLVSRFVRYIDDPLIETTITIVTAYGVYLVADFLHTSGILAVILAGLIVGSYGRSIGMSERTREAVDDFWSMIAFLANAFVFLLVGMQLNPPLFLSAQQDVTLLATAALAIVAVLVARFVMVLLLPGKVPLGIPIRSWHFVIFWSGLRGALSLALVLALPIDVPDRNVLVFSTYAVVLFTLLVQGFSLRWILKRLPSVSG
jgi:CPA1 family monovalent cation:H+ antiporter